MEWLQKIGTAAKKDWDSYENIGTATKILGRLRKCEKSPERWSSQGPGAWTPIKPPRSFSRSDYHDDFDDEDDDSDNDDDKDEDDEDEDDDGKLPEASCSAQSQFLVCCERGGQRGKQMSEIWSIIFCWSNMEYRCLHVEKKMIEVNCNDIQIFRYFDEADSWTNVMRIIFLNVILFYSSFYRETFFSFLTVILFFLFFWPWYFFSFFLTVILETGKL